MDFQQIFVEELGQILFVRHSGPRGLFCICMAQFMFNELLYTKTLAHPCTGTQLQKELPEEKKPRKFQTLS